MEQPGRLLGLGDRAPDFDLPAADHDARISLSDHYGRGPVLLLLLRGLYCAFCRRHISQLRLSCETLQDAGIPMLGVVIASADRSRLYFRYGTRPCFPVAAAPDRSIHRAYGLPAVERTPELLAELSRQAAGFLRELNLPDRGDPFNAFHHYDGWKDTAEDESEFKRPLQSVGYYLIDQHGLIRWARVGEIITKLPDPESLVSLLASSGV
jgi:peroxiredoxin